MKVSGAAACRLSQAESVANFGPCSVDSCADVVDHLYMLAFWEVPAIVCLKLCLKQFLGKDTMLYQRLQTLCYVRSSSKTISDCVALLYMCACTSSLCHSRSPHCLIHCNTCVSAWDGYHSIKSKAPALCLVAAIQGKLSEHYNFQSVRSARLWNLLDKLQSRD